MSTRTAALHRRALRNRVARAAVKIRLPIRERPDLVRLGCDYGGWWVPETLVSAGGTAYCAGVGYDISFDLALIERYGCEVWAFDPTPAVIEWVDGLRAPARWHFEPVGLWSRTEVIRFQGVRPISQNSRAAKTGYCPSVQLSVTRPFRKVGKIRCSFHASPGC